MPKLSSSVFTSRIKEDTWYFPHLVPISSFNRTQVISQYDKLHKENGEYIVYRITDHPEASLGEGGMVKDSTAVSGNLEYLYYNMSIQPYYRGKNITALKIRLPKTLKVAGGEGGIHVFVPYGIPKERIEVMSDSEVQQEINKYWPERKYENFGKILKS